MGKKEAVIDCSVVPEDILGELNRTSFLESSGHALRLKLERDGYIYFPELIDIKEIKEARNEIFKRLYEVDELEAPYLDGRFSHRSRRDELYNDRGAFWETVSNGKLLRNVSNGPILEKVTSQIFATPTVEFDYLFLRAVPQGRSTHLHCDAGFFTRVTKEVLTCWITFTEISLDNRPLFIVEGSHKFIDIHDNFKDFDVALNKEQKASIDEHPASIARQRNAKLLTTTFTPGDVLIFGMDTLHGAFENYAANNRIRLTCDIRCQPRDKPKGHRYFGVNPSGTTGAGYGELNGARPLIEDWHIR